MRIRIERRDDWPRLATLARMLADANEREERLLDLSNRAQRSAAEAILDSRAMAEAKYKADAEIEFLYDALQSAQRLTAENGLLQHRIMQLAARRNPEGRQYEGPRG